MVEGRSGSVAITLSTYRSPASSNGNSKGVAGELGRVMSLSSAIDPTGKYSGCPPLPMTLARHNINRGWLRRG